MSVRVVPVAEAVLCRAREGGTRCGCRWSSRSVMVERACVFCMATYKTIRTYTNTKTTPRTTAANVLATRCRSSLLAAPSPLKYRTRIITHRSHTHRITHVQRTVPRGSRAPHLSSRPNAKCAFHNQKSAHPTRPPAWQPDNACVCDVPLEVGIPRVLILIRRLLKEPIIRVRLLEVG